MCVFTGVVDAPEWHQDFTFQEQPNTNMHFAVKSLGIYIYVCVWILAFGLHREEYFSLFCAWFFPQQNFLCYTKN